MPRGVVLLCCCSFLAAVIDYHLKSIMGIMFLFPYNLTKIRRYPFMVALICNIILIVKMPHFLGILRMFSPLLLSSSTAISLASTTIAVVIILLATNVTMGNAQRQQLMSQASAIENGTALSIEDSFRVHVPEDW